MNKTITLEDKKYMLIKEYKNGYDEERIKELYTEYFEPFDYIVGDWSYGKLRLKGFCKKNNKHLLPFNDYSLLDNYLKDKCAVNAAYFVLEKSV